MDYININPELKIPIYQQLVDAIRVAVKKGIESAVEVELSEQGNIVVPRGTSTLKIISFIPEYLIAPLSKGDRVGRAAVYNGKNLVYETDIIVKKDIEKLSFSFLLKKVLLNITE